MLKRIVFATTNQGKLKEVAQLLDSRKIQVDSLDQYPQVAELEVAETGQTLEENAVLKAKTYQQLIKLPTASEDTGLFVAALNGRPGVFSARYAPTALQRNEKLLEELQNEANRAAFFRCVIAFVTDTETQLFTGRVDGQIAEQNRPGSGNGFGYDSVFIPDGFSETFAEMDQQQKNDISHRGQAVDKLKTYLINSDS